MLTIQILDIDGNILYLYFNGVKCHLGKDKPLDNAGQRSSDSDNLGQPCKFSWRALQFLEPIACLHLSATVQPFA